MLTESSHVCQASEVPSSLTLVELESHETAKPLHFATKVHLQFVLVAIG